MQIKARLRVVSRTRVTCASDAGYVDSNGYKCINYTSHFDSAAAEAIEPLGTVEQCVDLVGALSGAPWSDGYLDCSDFRDNTEWCQTWGDLNLNGEGTAKERCCSCGGGHRTARGPFVGATPGPYTLAQRILDEHEVQGGLASSGLQSCQQALYGAGAGGSPNMIDVHYKCCECGGGTRRHPVEEVEVVLAHINEVPRSPCLALCSPLQISPISAWAPNRCMRLPHSLASPSKTTDTVSHATLGLATRKDARGAVHD